MIVDATLAILHHLFAFGLVGMLMAEWALLRGEASVTAVRRIARYDQFYGLCAGLLLAVGATRVFFGLKGAAFYAANPFFWVKLALFAAVGALSIVPTVRYLRWRRSADFALPAEAQWIATRKLVVLQLHLLAGVMICAALMARGIGI